MCSSGRGTTLFASLLQGRNAAATDINPVAFCLTKSKAEVPGLDAVKARVKSLQKSYDRSARVQADGEAAELPPFFRRAFFHSTLRQLLFLRRRLRWRDETVDTFIGALVLGSLHGEMDRSPAYFSNQMPRTICLKPDYSLRYWRHHGLYPQKRNVFSMLGTKAEFRLQNGEAAQRGIAKLSDARLAAKVLPELAGRIRLVVTSPPYLDVTRFEEDQWLRLWFLGGEPNPTYGAVSKDDRHQNPDRYWNFLTDVWRGMMPLLRNDAIMVMRMGTKSLSFSGVSEGLLRSLRAVFPARSWLEKPVLSEIKGRQARAFNPQAAGCLYEADFIYAPFGPA